MKINKKEYIKNLRNIKLVVGNGFDIHCGLHSKYSHYFWLYKHLYSPLIEWYTKIEELFNDGSINQTQLGNIPISDGLNIWDYFFSIYFVIKKQKERKWCEVEKTISASLFVLNSEPKSEKEITDNLNSEFNSPINWDKVYKSYIAKRKSINDCNDVMAIVLRHFEFEKHKFYSFLLSQLDIFEKRFGLFIRNQVGKEITPGWGNFVYSSKYQEAIRQTISEIAADGHIKSIDSFNYSYFPDNNLESITRHINGNCINPIFGVDSEYFPNENGFIFTKTNRRLELDFLSDDYFSDVPFENLFIYGHSLNKADYSYFFPILDKLKLLDLSNESKIVLCFSEEQNDDDINKIKLDFYALIIAYAKYSYLDPNRFLDSLTTQGRILFHIIPSIQKNIVMMQHTHFDSPWEGCEE